MIFWSIQEVYFLSDKKVINWRIRQIIFGLPFKEGGGTSGIEHQVQLQSLFGTGCLTFWQQGAGQKPKVGNLKLGNWKK